MSVANLPAPPGASIGFADIVDEAWPQQERRFFSLLAEELFPSTQLTDAVRHQVMSGGKRIRAALPVLVHRLLARESREEDIDAALWAGLALELAHAATLCLDDVMDSDRERRHLPTVWALHGVPQAINAGSLLFFLAARALERAPLPPQAMLRASHHASYSLRRVSRGQGLELELRTTGRLPTCEEWNEIARLKTGGLFAHGFVMGGVIAGVDEEALAALDDIGLRLGELFQLQDDLLDLVGDKGREVAADLWEGKPSWLVAECAKRLADVDRDNLRETLYRPRDVKTADDVQRLRGLLDETASIERGLCELDSAAAALTRSVEVELPRLAAAVSLLIARVQAPLAHAPRSSADVLVTAAPNPSPHDLDAGLVAESVAVVRALGMPTRGRDLAAWLKGVIPFYIATTLPVVPADKLRQVVLGKILYGFWNMWVDDEIDEDGRRDDLDRSLAFLSRQSPAPERGAVGILQHLLHRFPDVSPDRLALVRMDLLEVAHGFAFEWTHQRHRTLQNAREYLRYSTMTLSLKIFLDLDLLYCEPVARDANYRELRLAYDDLSIALKLASDIGSLRREVTSEDSANMVRIWAADHAMDDRPRAGELFEDWLARVDPAIVAIRDQANAYLGEAIARLRAVPGIDVSNVVRGYQMVFERYSSGSDMR